MTIRNVRKQDHAETYAKSPNRSDEETEHHQHHYQLYRVQQRRPANDAQPRSQYQSARKTGSRAAFFVFAGAFAIV